MFVLFILITLLLSIAHAREVPFTLEDREMLRSIYIRMEKLETKVEVAFNQIDKRFEQVDKKIDMLLTYMGIMAGAFVRITAATIGFAIWDRRSMIKPFEDKSKEIEKRFEKGEEMDRKFLEALKTPTQKDRELAELLKRYN
ncbi:MAG: hypothetical protein D6804_07020, partial [Aquificota bacterium]